MTQRTFRLVGANRAAFTDITSRECLSAGPAGSGKTLASSLKLYHFCQTFPRARCLIVRKTRASLTETALVTWERDILGEGHPIIARPIERSHRHAYKFPNGSVLVTGGMDKPDKILSSEWDLIYTPEATELSLVDWETLGGRLRAGAAPYDQLIADCNPTTPEHWLKKRCEAGLTKLYESKHWENPRYYDADARKWTEEGKRYVKGRLQNLTGHRRKRFLEGVWAAAEGLVYAFDDIHRLPKDWTAPPDWKRIWAIDWGDRSPTALLVAAIHPETLSMHVVREVYRTHMRADMLGKWAKEWLSSGKEPKPASVVCDHDPDKKAAFEAESGLFLRMADKQDRDRGIQKLQARFDHGPGQPPRFFVRDCSLDHEPDRLCVEEGRPTSLASELSAYTWDPKFINDTPIEDNDHACDCLRYMTMEVDRTMLKPGQVSVLTGEVVRPTMPGRHAAPKNTARKVW